MEIQNKILNLSDGPIARNPVPTIYLDIAQDSKVLTRIQKNFSASQPYHGTRTQVHPFGSLLVLLQATMLPPDDSKRSSGGHVWPGGWSILQLVMTKAVCGLRLGLHSKSSPVHGSSSTSTPSSQYDAHIGVPTTKWDWVYNMLARSHSFSQALSGAIRLPPGVHSTTHTQGAPKAPSLLQQPVQSRRKPRGFSISTFLENLFGKTHCSLLSLGCG